jgi:hypothetical protein
MIANSSWNHESLVTRDWSGTSVETHNIDPDQRNPLVDTLEIREERVIWSGLLIDSGSK